MMNIYQERFIDETDKLIGTSEYSNWLEQQLNTLEEQNKQMLDMLIRIESGKDVWGMEEIKELIDTITGKKIEEEDNGTIRTRQFGSGGLNE